MGTWFLPLRDMVAIFSRDLTQDAQFGRSELPGRGVLCGHVHPAGSGLRPPPAQDKRDVIFFGGLLATAMQIIYGLGAWLFLLPR